MTLISLGKKEKRTNRIRQERAEFKAESLNRTIFQFVSFYDVTCDPLEGNYIKDKTGNLYVVQNNYCVRFFYGGDYLHTMGSRFLFSCGPN